MNTILSNAKQFAASHSSDRSVPSQLELATGVDVKFYSSQTSEYSALFAIITMGEGPSALQIINVYGKFDHERIGSSTNLPPEMLASATGTTVHTNPLIRQFIAYKEDAAGKIYFANGDSAPPACDSFNYCFMIFGDGSDSFGIKSSNWKAGDSDVYTFKMSDLTLLEMDIIPQSAQWCRDPAPLAAAPIVGSSVPRASGGKAMLTLIIVLVPTLLLIALVYLSSQQNVRFFKNK
jgi:hypothetical protein